ncbi:hypothetical protein WJX73_009842 [Symbiochloris irregularis]|uniref:STI1 domain-containing protein n=1 Tax=Symbiochloris irregularis TaxID=706552 RepID=A0AAW1PGP2_9CHLO
MAEAFKAKGNAAFSAQRFEEAIDFFSQAIEVDSSNHVLFSNRSAAKASLKRFAEALEDAEQVVKIKRDWPKGYSRKGAAYMGLRKWSEAIEAYEQGLELDPDNAQMQEALEDAKDAEAGGQGDMPGGLNNMFGPTFLGRLSMDPRTKPYLEQQDFLAMLQTLQKNPGAMQMYMGDPRFKMALQVGLGINMMSGDDFQKEQEQEQQGNGTASHPPTRSSQPKRQPEPAPAPAPREEERVEENSEEIEARQQKERAAEEKTKGNAAYKARRFEEAIGHYDKAYDLNDTDISSITNRAAVHFEMGSYEAAVKDCDTAVERGRELRADYKLVAKALTRKGNALMRLDRIDDAILAYQKALTEHRNADTLKLLQVAEKKLKEQKEQSYINMDLATEEREKGNKAFQEDRYPDAVKHYTEALARGPPSVNPEAHKLYSNRAACYTKLTAFPEGIKDADECIRLAPDFAKGYSRKGHLQYFMKEYDEALKTYERGLEADPNNEEIKEAVRRCYEAISKTMRGEGTEEELKDRQARGMADPEIQRILSDPIMHQVLEDMQSDPRSAQKHMQHPQIAAKIQKLVKAGIVQMR